MTKNPWLVFRLKHEISKQNFLEFSFMEKMLIIKLLSGYSHDKKSLVSVSVETRNFKTKLFRIFFMEKMLIIQLHSGFSHEKKILG